ncbi:MAG: sulfatase-like hydrolase/transferase, partial [Spirochaetia bacterium]|nr:sulfatase-like hydrolase/transferase [Spirochaetia bacterium]
MNNVFSVGKSLIFLRLFPHEKYVPDPEDRTFKDYVQDFKEAVRPCLNAGFWLFVAIVFLFALQCRVLKLHKEHFVYIYAITALFAVLVFLALFITCLLRRKEKSMSKADMLKVATAAIFFVLIPAVGFFFKCHGAEGSLLKKIIFVSAVAADALLYICFKNILRYYIPVDKDILPSKGSEAQLYCWCTAFLSLSITLIWPLWVYFSAPEETGVGLLSILASNVPVLIIWSISAFLIFNFSSPKGRSKEAEVVLFFSALVICYHFILPNNYGELDKTLLHFADKLDNKSLFVFIGDIFVITFIFLAARILSNKYAVQSRNVIALLLCCMVGITVIKTSNYIFSDTSQERVYEQTAQLPENNSLVNGYTRTGKNVVLFLSDMFTGGYLDTILEECPEFREKFSGFTWYRNAVSPSWQTVCSMPSIFAGDDYLPLAMNEMPGTGREKIEKSAKLLFDQFREKDYSIAVVDGNATKLSPQFLSTVDNLSSDVYIKFWQEKYYKENNSNTIIKQGHLFIMLSLFQSSPYFLKPVIYNESNWFIFSRKAIFWAVEKHVFPNYAYMKLLPEISNADMKRNTFKYIHNSLTHAPFGIDDDGELVRPGEFPDNEKKSFYSGRGAYNTQREFLYLFDKYCTWLKEQGLYDNTYIILISDHGNVYADYNPLTDDKIINGFNPLFMIKEFDAKGNLQINNDVLISSHDAEKFMKNALYDTPVVIPKGRKIQAVHYDNSDKFLDTGIIDIINAYDVERWVYDPKNWKEIK